MNFVCQACNYRMDTQECLEEPLATPREGDLSVCLNCAAIYCLRGGVWHMLSDEELAKLPPGIRMELTIITRGIRAVITEDLALNQRLGKP